MMQLKLARENFHLMIQDLKSDMIIIVGCKNFSTIFFIIYNITINV